MAVTIHLDVICTYKRFFAVQRIGTVSLSGVGGVTPDACKVATRVNYRGAGDTCRSSARGTAAREGVCTLGGVCNP